MGMGDWMDSHAEDTEALREYLKIAATGDGGMNDVNCSTIELPSGNSGVTFMDELSPVSDK